MPEAFLFMAVIKTLKYIHTKFHLNALYGEEVVIGKNAQSILVIGCHGFEALEHYCAFCYGKTTIIVLDAKSSIW